MRGFELLLAVVMALGVATVAAACGGSDEDASARAAATSGEGAEERDEAATPAESVAEIGAVRDGLEHALEEYRNGEAAEAEETVGDAYLEHFEKVEHSLEERDAELMEDLEVLISTTIRNEIEGGAPVTKVERLVGEANDKLARAETLLQER